MNMRLLLATLCLLPGLATAEVQVEKVRYMHADKTFEGTYAYDSSWDEPRPGVLVVPDWMGPRAYFDRMAERIVGLGYAAFIADVYGVEVRPQNTQEASEASQSLLQGENRTTLRERMQKSLEVLKEQEAVDPEQTAAFGFCFGGTSVLELARTGAVLEGVISFHGGLSTPVPAQAERVLATIYVLHGADDPFVPDPQVAAFVEEMRQAKAQWALISFGGALHSFTDPGANMTGRAEYDAWAARHAEMMLVDLLQQLFHPAPDSELEFLAGLDSAEGDADERD